MSSTQKTYRVAILGATGLVGRTMLDILEERRFPVSDIVPLASARSAGREISFKGRTYIMQEPSKEVFADVDIALFSAGSGASREWASVAASQGAVVIDNSSAFRMDPDVPLVVPEVNPGAIFREDGRPAMIIANPNCSTIQMVVVLKPLHERYHIRRVIVSTYQSVTGKGKAGRDALESELAGEKQESFTHVHQIAYNAVPHIDVFQENGYTKEEMKMVNETRKIMGDDAISVSPTTVRIPVYGGHGEALNIEFDDDFDIDEVRRLLASSPGIAVQDDPSQDLYPMPLTAYEKDEVFVGRLRRDYWHPKTLNMWIVADNLRKGAATNAVQIAEQLVGRL
ncbi:aspartate-semialdehyde dehydrogenase [Prosthecochloris sp. N3]|uniref:Aspartate-semialdehyde dehydrogenase n=1 Tax=Prosthecochloris ethylica TaxID=2743976 RepID=A0ABR9XP63_9CHLB|nr:MULTISPECIES: aspartate-semialdehyde dehydrogenase [Prosthecochloris]MEC9486532.1 aspartate-semialdehyde dehydrogenase [Prosthecochloris sp.]MBF0585767.1 aspartate-semialdehyde dehydrogenase [Prosthecochloris ethylica]MBF0635677.1 aspartate-semialdehyde dehydrogenase [Prosthecochloris ethylica]NUK46976.1 aspartate-semialdehyde dehydrogenase [Prosthecochloris ethylica]RNA65465.1 aspartate-semialdehyde dehydrogenase [Prosthecochloris sp. ZM_2]